AGSPSAGEVGDGHGPSARRQRQAGRRPDGTRSVPRLPPAPGGGRRQGRAGETGPHGSGRPVSDRRPVRGSRVLGRADEGRTVGQQGQGAPVANSLARSGQGSRQLGRQDRRSVGAASRAAPTEKSPCRAAALATLGEEFTPTRRGSRDVQG